MTDNAWNDTQGRAVAEPSITHLLIKPHCPWQNGKVKRLSPSRPNGLSARLHDQRRPHNGPCPMARRLPTLAVAQVHLTPPSKEFVGARSANLRRPHFCPVRLVPISASRVSARALLPGWRWRSSRSSRPVFRAVCDEEVGGWPRAVMVPALSIVVRRMTRSADDPPNTLTYNRTSRWREFTALASSGLPPSLGCQLRHRGEEQHGQATSWCRDRGASRSRAWGWSVVRSLHPLRWSGRTSCTRTTPTSTGHARERQPRHAQQQPAPAERDVRARSRSSGCRCRSGARSRRSTPRPGRSSVSTARSRTAASATQSSRTTVGVDGSVWVGHRGPGGVTHVGLDELNQCVDRNGNGTIETSTGYGDVKPWPGTALGRRERSGRVHPASRQHGPRALNMGDSRHMSIDANEQPVGRRLQRRRPVRAASTGRPVLSRRRCVDLPLRRLRRPDRRQRRHLVGVGGGSGAAALGPGRAGQRDEPACIGELGVYGMAVDAGRQHLDDRPRAASVARSRPDGNTVHRDRSRDGAGNAQGLAVDSNGDVWVSSSLFCGGGCTIGHLKNDGTFVGSVPTRPAPAAPASRSTPTGKVWTANLNSNTATRIDPNAAARSARIAARHPIGAVDLTVRLPGGAGRSAVAAPRTTTAT